MTDRLARLMTDDATWVWALMALSLAGSVVGAAIGFGAAYLQDRLSEAWARRIDWEGIE